MIMTGSDDPLADRVLLAGDALGVDLQQHRDGVARPASCVEGTPVLSHIDTAACRRS
jgi:hypothetical protein